MSHHPYRRQRPLYLLRKMQLVLHTTARPARPQLLLLRRHERWRVDPWKAIRRRAVVKRHWTAGRLLVCVVGVWAARGGAAATTGFAPADEGEEEGEEAGAEEEEEGQEEGGGCEATDCDAGYGSGGESAGLGERFGRGG